MEKARRNRTRGVQGTENRGALAVYPKPSVVTRTEWGCPDGQDNSHGISAYTTVTHLIVHHTATPNDATDWAAEVRGIWELHIFTNGWSDIGYNYLIDPNGVIYEGRAGGDNVQGAHFSCANANTMGVALLGTFIEAAPTEQALASLKYLLAWKCNQRDIYPLGTTFHGGTGLELRNISGHRDGNSALPNSGACSKGTECPGDMLYSMLPAIREGVRTLLSVVNHHEG